MKKYLFFGAKKIEYYNGLTIKADLGLHEQIANRLKVELPSGSKILDFGAGEGALTARLNDCGYCMVAVDKDEENFKLKGAKFYRVDFDSAEDVSNFVTSHQGLYDAVLGIEVIEHVQDQWRYIEQLMNMVKPGGLVLITTPNITSWLSRLLFLFTGQFHQFADTDLKYGHISPISPWELGHILSESGGKDIQIIPAGTLPPIYLTGFNKLSIMNLFILPLRPLMRGIIDGWCVMATAYKPL